MGFSKEIWDIRMDISTLEKAEKHYERNGQKGLLIRVQNQLMAKHIELSTLKK